MERCCYMAGWVFLDDPDGKATPTATNRRVGVRSESAGPRGALKHIVTPEVNNVTRFVQ